MRGRGETELAIAFEPLPLRQQIEADAPRVVGGFLERGTARDDERKTRHAFEAFVRRRDEIVRLQLREVERHAAETAHRIDDETAAMFAYDSGDLVDRI